MTTLEILLLIAIPVAFFLGFHFCKIRYAVNDLLKVTDLLTKLVKGEISPEEASEEVKRMKEE